MSARSPLLVALAVFVVAPVIARSQPYPSTTDEARALAGKMLPAREAPRPIPPGTIASTTDETRALAHRMLPRGPQESARTIRAVSSTDEARVVAGGLLTVAPASRHEAVASCGRVCNCGHRG